MLAEERNLIETAERETMVREFARMLAHLRTAMAMDTLDKNRVAITEHIAAILADLGRMGTDLERRGLRQAGRYVREEVQATAVIAQVTNWGGWMPATSNGVERVMGVVADRCKRKRACWERGLETLLKLLPVRKTRPFSFGWAVRTYLRDGSLPDRPLPVGSLVNKL